MIEEALVSEQLRNAIEVILRCYRHRGYRWNELFAETDAVLSEVAVRALKRVDTFDPHRARPVAWLMGIACNVLRERRRWSDREARRSVPQASKDEAAWQEIIDRLRTGPHAAAEPGRVWQALDRLSPEEQRVLLMRYVEDRPYSEIAHALGISEEAARARVCRALRALREQFEALERREGQ
jgi:RNA polymerase sigma-70 factor (ECF subfamily)